MADAAAIRAKMSNYILWHPNLWRYAKPPNTYKVAFISDTI